MGAGGEGGVFVFDSVPSGVAGAAPNGLAAGQAAPLGRFRCSVVSGPPRPAAAVSSSGTRTVSTVRDGSRPRFDSVW